MKDGIISNLLTDDDIARICKITTPYFFTSDSKLFYEGQTPIVAYLVLEGQINLTKNKRLRAKVLPGHILGLSELLKHQALKLAAEALPKTKVIFLDLSTVKEILNENPAGLALVFENILESA